MSRICRGCQKRIRDRLTLYKITIYIILSRMSRMFWGLCTPCREGVSGPAERRADIHLLSGRGSLKTILSADIRDKAELLLYFRWLAVADAQKRIRAASATDGVSPRHAPPALLRLRPGPADLHRDEVPQRRAGEGRREGGGHRLLQEIRGPLGVGFAALPARSRRAAPRPGRPRSPPRTEPRRSSPAPA